MSLCWQNFLYKCLGVLARRTTNKEFVNRVLDRVFSTVHHDSQVEREGCAIGVGFCAASHTDVVLDKLAAVSKAPDSAKKSTGLFGFIKVRHLLSILIILSMLHQG